MDTKKSGTPCWEKKKANESSTCFSERDSHTSIARRIFIHYLPNDIRVEFGVYTDLLCKLVLFRHII